MKLRTPSTSSAVEAGVVDRRAAGLGGQVEHGAPDRRVNGV